MSCVETTPIKLTLRFVGSMTNIFGTFCQDKGYKVTWSVDENGWNQADLSFRNKTEKRLFTCMWSEYSMFDLDKGQKFLKLR